MVFVLRSQRAPLRTLRETDDDGTERTFWLWKSGAWVVALRTKAGELSCSHARGLEVVIEEAGSVTIVRVLGGGPPDEDRPR